MRVVMQACEVDLDNRVGRYGNVLAVNLEVDKLRSCPSGDRRDRAVESQGFVLGSRTNVSIEKMPI